MTRTVSVAIVASVLAVLAAPASEPPAEAAPERLFAPDYPVEVAVVEHAARFHWLDSLAGLEIPGTSAGKTVTAHREAYIRLLGKPTDEDRAWIRRFAELRLRFAEARLAEYRADGDADFSALLVLFLDAPDEAAALDRARDLLGERDAAVLAAALDHFRQRYERFWRDGKWLDAFLDDVRGSRDARVLGRSLARIASLYGVATPLEPPPRIVLAPTPSGYGTHATAHGRHLLIELRPLDRLEDAASVIAHENAHLLFTRMPDERREAFEQPFLDAGERGRRAWRTLLEALPTALGQGVVDRRFRGATWSTGRPWYHRPEVDAYAKAIYPIVAEAFDGRRTLDGALGRRLLDAWPEPEPTPRSP